MAGTTRVPRRNDLFDQYIRNSTSHLLNGTSPVNWQRLGLTQTEMDGWEEYHDKWEILYPKYSNKSKRTSSVTLTKNNLKKDFSVYTRALLTRMAGSTALTEEDRLVMRLRKPDRIMTSRGLITDVPVVTLVSMPGGRIFIKCRIEHDSNRASIHPLADAIEVKIKIGSPEPGNSSDCPITKFSTKAIFHYEAGAENAGQRIYVYCRYVNFTNEANNGSFSTVRTATIQE